MSGRKRSVPFRAARDAGGQSVQDLVSTFKISHPAAIEIGLVSAGYQYSGFPVFQKTGFWFRGESAGVTAGEPWCLRR